MDHKIVKNDAPSQAESCKESYKHSQRALLRQSLSLSTQYYFKLGTNTPKLSVSERPWGVDSEKKCKWKCLRSSRNVPQRSADCKTKKQNFSLCSAIIECRAMLKGKKDHKVIRHPVAKNHEYAVDNSSLQGPSRNKFKGDMTHPHVFGLTIIEPQHCGGHQSNPVRPLAES